MGYLARRARWMMGWLGAGLALLVWSGRGRGQAATPGSVQAQQIHGTVVDALTGRPVARALVTSADRRLATMTDGNGRFVLAVVPAGVLSQPGYTGPGPAYPTEVQLSAQRPGYLPRQPPLLVPLDGSAGSVRLEMVPAGNLTGRVFGQDDVPARGVEVVLLGRTVVNGERPWTIQQARLTDAAGNFSFDELRASEYTVATREWAGDEPKSPTETGVTEQYPPDFLGDVPALGEASRAAVRPGETLRVDLHLRRTRYYPVTVPVVIGSPGVMVEVLVPGGVSLFALGYDVRSHAVQGALPDGDYTLLLRQQQPEIASARVQLQVGGAPVRTAPVTLTTPATLTVRVHVETAAPAPERQMQASVELQAGAPGMPSFRNLSTPEHPDEVTLPGVETGVYAVAASSNFGYVSSFRCGAADLAVERLTVTAAGVACPLELTLRDDPGTVSGTAEMHGAAANAESVAFLLPAINGQLMQDRLGPDGAFTFGIVPPGRYEVFAVSQFPNDFAWRDPATLDHLSGKGVAINVEPHGNVRVSVPLGDVGLLEVP